MERKRFKSWLISAGIFAGLWVAVRYFLPVILPFVLGFLAARAAEPGVRFLGEKLHMPRGAASFLVVCLGYVFLIGILWIIGAGLYREITSLLAVLPDFFRSIADLVEKIRLWAVELTGRAPEGMRDPLTRAVTDIFAGGAGFLEQAAAAVFDLAGNVVGGLPGSAMLIATAVISSFMISAQLPGLPLRFQHAMSRQGIQKIRKAYHRIRFALGGWLKAQMKLSGMTFGIVGVGLLILRIGNPVFWALIVALVDAVPLLGTGTILIPWALLALLSGDGVRALGLAGLYVTAMLVRSGLEPKLVGHHLGINPLLTLMALYGGYRLWGVGGMILAPILTVTAKQLSTLRE